MSEELAMDVSEAPEVSVAEPSQESPAAEPSQSAVAEPQQQNVWSAFKALPDFRDADDRAIAQSLYQSYERERLRPRSCRSTRN